MRCRGAMDNGSHLSAVIIEDSFGELVTPSIQGSLGPEKLPFVIVILPGMNDDIYSFSNLLHAIV